jgi:hypothetical protein
MGARADRKIRRKRLGNEKKRENSNLNPPKKC